MKLFYRHRNLKTYTYLMYLNLGGGHPKVYSTADTLKQQNEWKTSNKLALNGGGEQTEKPYSYGMKYKSSHQC